MVNDENVRKERQTDDVVDKGCWCCEMWAERNPAELLAWMSWQAGFQVVMGSSRVDFRPAKYIDASTPQSHPIKISNKQSTYSSQKKTKKNRITKTSIEKVYKGTTYQ